MVEGGEDAAVTVLSWLSAQGVVPHRLRVADGSLDTAYLDLTGDPTDQPQEIA